MARESMFSSPVTGILMTVTEPPCRHHYRDMLRLTTSRDSCT